MSGAVHGVRCATKKGPAEGIYPEAIGSSPSAVRNGPGVAINGISPGLHVATVDCPWESVETVESESKPSVLSQEEAGVGVSYMPPTGCTCSACRGEPCSGETLARRMGATLTGGGDGGNIRAVCGEGGHLLPVLRPAQCSVQW